MLRIRCSRAGPVFISEEAISNIVCQVARVVREERSYCNFEILARVLWQVGQDTVLETAQKDIVHQIRTGEPPSPQTFLDSCIIRGETQKRVSLELLVGFLR